MDNKKEIVAERIKSEIAKIDNKETHIYFFVLDTKGNPSGSLEYIYKNALILKENGYNISILYQTSKDEEFVGVREWLGDKYADLEHININSGDISVSPSDILFVPEIFSNVMIQTKKLPCKKIAILQNYNYLVEQMPFSVQWGDLGVVDCITNTEFNANLIKESFPYVKTSVITPYIDEVFGVTSENKKMIINIVSKDQSDINKIVKPFYWKYPQFKWVSFRELRGLSKKDFASALREAEVTIWVDEDSSFGYSAVEAMKSGNIVLGKVTDNEMPWMTLNGEPTDACIWFNNFNDVHKMLASIIRAIITDKVPEKIFEDADKVSSQYSKEKTASEIVNYVQGILNNRRKEIENLLENI